jgi:hypothetical protein
MTTQQHPALTAADLRAALAAAAVQPEAVDVPGVGTVYVRAPSWLAANAAPSDDLAAAVGLSSADMAKAWALAVVLCDATGAPLFDATNPEHLRTVAQLGRDAAAPLVRAANKVYGGDEKNA